MQLLKIILSISLLLPLGIMNAQFIAPLSVGNEYVFKFTDYDTLGNILSSSIDTMTIDSDTLILGERWFSSGINYLTNRSDGLWQWETETGLSYLFFKYPTAVGEIYTTPWDSIFVVSIDTLITITLGTFSCIRYDVKEFQDQYHVSRFVAPGYFLMYAVGYQKTQGGMWYLNVESELLSYSILNNINENEISASSFSLLQNFPNPFNPSTTFKYQIPELSFVTLKVYDVLGKEIITIVNEEKSAGTYEINWIAKNLPSGIYFYKLQAGSPSTGSGQSFVETKKMILMK